MATDLTNPSGSTATKTIVLVHGLFVNPQSWNRWKAWFEDKGYTVHAPANPLHSGDPASLRTNPDGALGKLNFEDVVHNLVRFIDALPEKPILIGHSLGGLAVQKLIAMGKGVAGVLIDGAAPAGIITFKWSFVKSNFPVINPLKGNTPFYPTKKWFHYTFGNTLTREESDQVFEKYVVPESRNIARGTLKSFAKIDFKQPHAPLLFIAGEKDHIIPAALNKKNFNAYKHAGSKRAYKEFAGRSHYTVGEKGWEEVAGYVLNWLREK